MRRSRCGSRFLPDPTGRHSGTFAPKRTPRAWAGRGVRPVFTMKQTAADRGGYDSNMQHYPGTMIVTKRWSLLAFAVIVGVALFSGDVNGQGQSQGRGRGSSGSGSGSSGSSGSSGTSVSAT